MLLKWQSCSEALSILLFIYVVEEEVFVVVEDESLPKKLKLCGHMAQNYPRQLRQEVNQAGRGRNRFFLCFYGGFLTDVIRLHRPNEGTRNRMVENYKFDCEFQWFFYFTNRLNLLGIDAELLKSFAVEE